MELILPIAALIVLCSVLVARKVLITHQCFGYCWAVLAQHQGCLSNIPPLTSRLGVGKILGGDTARTADPNWPKGYSMPYDVCSAIKARRRRNKGGAFVYLCLSSGATATHTETLLPRKRLDIAFWWEVENKVFWFSLLLCATFAFALLNCPYLDPWAFHYIFSPLSSWGGGVIERLRWAPGIQPESTHHIEGLWNVISEGQPQYSWKITMLQI